MIDPELIPQVARRFKALGEPARLALLAALQHGERSVSELVADTRRGQPNVSQHLRELAQAGLIASRRDGHHVYYRIADRYVLRICDAVCRSLGRPPAPTLRSSRGSAPRPVERARAVAGVSRG